MNKEAVKSFEEFLKFCKPFSLTCRWNPAVHCTEYRISVFEEVGKGVDSFEYIFLVNNRRLVLVSRKKYLKKTLDNKDNI